jgi:hypothetical protein
MKMKKLIMAAAMIVGLGGIVMANGQQELASGGSTGSQGSRLAVAGQGLGTMQGGGQGFGVGQGAGTGQGAGQGGGQGRLAGSGTYGVNAAQDQAFRDTELAVLAAMPVGTLQAAELANLLYMWEEEKLARDVYARLGELYRLPVFSNIARSEQTHMDQLAFLFDRYKLAVPAADTPGMFQNSGLASAYKDLVARGSESLGQAIAVGIDMEEMDIQDLQKAIQSSANQDVQYILNQLLMGSQNHLSAFNRQARR